MSIQEPKKQSSILDNITTALSMSSSKKSGETDAETVSTATGVNPGIDSDESIKTDISSYNSPNLSSEKTSIETPDPDRKDVVVTTADTENKPIKTTSKKKVSIKKKKNTKFLMTDKDIKDILEDLKNTEKTETDLLKKMESAIDKIIENEKTKLSKNVKRLQHEKAYLLKKVTDAFTPKKNKPLFRHINSPPSKKNTKKKKNTQEMNKLF